MATPAHITDIEVRGQGADSTMAAVRRQQTWANMILHETFYKSPDNIYRLTKLLMGEKIIKPKNSGVSVDEAYKATRKLILEISIPPTEQVNTIPYGSTDAGEKFDVGWKTKECNFAQYSFNAAMLRDDLNELVRATSHFRDLVKGAALQKYMHDERLIINLLSEDNEIEEIFPGTLENVDGVVDAAEGVADKISFDMISKAVLSFEENTTLDIEGNKRANPIGGFNFSEQYLVIITPRQKRALIDDPKFDKLFGDKGGVTSEYQMNKLRSTYLGVRFEVSTAAIKRKGTGEGEDQKIAQAAIIVGGRNVIRPVHLEGQSYLFNVAFQDAKPLGSDHGDIANLTGLRIVAKWFKGLIIPDASQIKLLCYKDEGIY